MFFEGSRVYNLLERASGAVATAIDIQFEFLLLCVKFLRRIYGKRNNGDVDEEQAEYNFYEHKRFHGRIAILWFNF